MLNLHKLTIKRGQATIVKTVSLSVEAGKIVGIIGPNGAGKSTLLTAVVGLSKFTSGCLTICGTTIHPGEVIPADVRKRIAYIPEQPTYYEDLTVQEHFEWKTRLWERTGESRDETALHRLVDEFQLGPHLRKFPHQCSKGTLQKIGIVCALMVPFDILIVDEPHIGLDVMAIRRLKEHIFAARDDGKTVFMSTHVLDAAERMCDRVNFFVDGHIIEAGSLTDLRERIHDPEASLEDLFLRSYNQYYEMSNKEM